MKRVFIIAVLAIFALSMTAFAQGKGKGNSKGQGQGNPHAQAAQGHGNQGKGAAKSHRDDDGWEVRNGFQYRSYEGDSRPPGWNKGKKVGWGNCDVPPGQAKKGGCYSYLHQGRRYYWYRDDIGRIIVRRPVIRAGVEIGL
ncbi:MAG TPA: hypothetical protein VN577_16445 [Terriglobales bacterium]|nr:hypothetical protein [Terriglobales bacterium]